MGETEKGRSEEEQDDKDQKLNPLTDALYQLVGNIPRSSIVPGGDADGRARGIVTGAAARAALVSGALAIPPGPLGWLTILPDLLAIWRIQSQMVADLAAVFGKSAGLSREKLLYCLFRHSAAHAVSELVLQVGERILVRRTGTRTIQAVLRRIGVKVTQRAIGSGVTRWIPIIGALGVGAYAFWDTSQVGHNAIELFRAEWMDESADEQDKIALTASNEKVVCCELDREAILIANRGEALEWEQFALIFAGENKTAAGLLAANQRWVCCDGDRGCQLAANRERMDAWETFKLEWHADEGLSLRAFNGLLVYADPQRDWTLWADREVLGEQTVFGLRRVKEDSA